MTEPSRDEKKVLVPGCFLSETGGSYVIRMKNLILARAERSGMTCDDCFEDWQTLLGYLTDDYSTQERFFRQYYNAFKNRLNEPFRTDGQRKKDPLGYIATRSNLLSIFEELISRDLSGFMSDILVCGEI